MSDRLADFWCQEYKAARGVKALFSKRDAVILHQLLDHAEDRWALAYAIRKYLRTDDDYTRRNGWSVKGFHGRVQGLLVEYREMKILGRHRELQRDLKRASEQLAIQFPESEKIVGRISGGRRVS